MSLRTATLRLGDYFRIIQKIVVDKIGGWKYLVRQMDIINEIIGYADILYKYAYVKTHDTNEAHDLVQETYLSVLLAINNGKEIKNVKAYLMKILNYKFNDLLRKKYHKHTIVYNICHSYTHEVNQYKSIDADDDIERSETVKKVMRELANLSTIYREVMVQYYMENKSVNEIADNLAISRGTVLSRLDVGRKKIKEGVTKMNISSYKPENLTITMWGFMGLNNEPYNVITSLIEQNLLIMAYEKPLTMEEICEQTGVPAVYIEESVDKLVRNEFMKKISNRVFTNFLIIEEDLVKSKREVQLEYVNNSFSRVKNIFMGLIAEYKKTGILNKFNDTQLCLYGFHSIFQQVRYFLMDALKLLKVDDYPDRPNGGKWIIYSGHKIDNKAVKPLHSIRVTGDCYTEDSHLISYEEWNTELSITVGYDNNLLMHPCDSMLLLYNIHKGKDIDPMKMTLIPQLLKLGLLSNSEDNKKAVNVPIISATDFNIINKINTKYQNKCIEAIGASLIKMIKANAIKCPKHINPVSPCTHLMLIDGLPILYTLKAAELGFVELCKDKNYPVILIIEKE